jgi:hypothetical protein
MKENISQQLWTTNYCIKLTDIVNQKDAVGKWLGFESSPNKRNTKHLKQLSDAWSYFQILAEPKTNIKK